MRTKTQSIAPRVDLKAIATRGSGDTPPPNEPQYISVKEACHRWGISKTSLYSALGGQHPLAREGKSIRSIKFGAKTLIDRQAGDEFFSSLPPFKPN